MEYLIRFSQSHETFRMPETQAIAESGGFEMKVLYYDLEVGFPFPWSANGHVRLIDLSSSHTVSYTYPRRMQRAFS